MARLVSKTFWLCLIAGVVCALGVAPAAIYETRYYQRVEPFYANPVGGSSISLRSDTFGKGYFGASRNGGRRHKGIDIAAPVGRAILASKSGRVIFSGWEKGYGEWVEIRHPDGLTSRYAHLYSRDVSVGDWVRQNQRIGACGKTGNADDARIAPHVHFEIRYGSQALNPAEGLLVSHLTQGYNKS